MTIQILIWAASALATGAIVTFILCRIIMNNKLNELADKAKKERLELKAQKEYYEQHLIEANAKLEGQDMGFKADCSEKDNQAADIAIKEQKTKYEKLLAEANAKCSELDSQLKAALDGKIDTSVQEQLASIEKLKKKIKELEDDLDEKDDDLSDSKKKLSRKDGEIADLQNALHTEQKMSKILHDDLESTKQELKDTVADLDLKAGSLGFIQEILSAKDVSTEDVEKLTKNVNQMEAFIKGQYMDLNAFLYHGYNFTWDNVAGQEGFRRKKDYILSSSDQWASSKKKSWLDGKTTIAFVGEFSAGKTSIVNRILSQDNPKVPQLPVSTKATTAIPTYIAGGKTTSYCFISGDGRRKAILEDTFRSVSKDILGQIKGVSSLIKYFVMTYDNSNLNGLSILDTPGFSSNDSEDGIRTIEVINECDALFWVFDVNNGEVNRTSLDIIKKHLNKPLFIVINKIDTKAVTEVDKVEQHIRKTLNEAGLSVEAIIRFSSHSPLNTIMEPIRTVTKISVRDTFLSDINDDLNQLLSILDNSQKEQRASYDAAFQEGESITEQFISSMNWLKSDCDKASGIPRFQEGFKVFGIGTDDKYVMSVYQARTLQNLLSTIAGTHMQNLAQDFDKRVEKAADIQQAWANVCDIKNAWQKTKECYDQFNKLKKGFK